MGERELTMRRTAAVQWHRDVPIRYSDSLTANASSDFAKEPLLANNCLSSRHQERRLLPPTEDMQAAVSSEVFLS